MIKPLAFSDLEFGVQPFPQELNCSPNWRDILKSRRQLLPGFFEEVMHAYPSCAIANFLEPSPNSGSVLWFAGYNGWEENSKLN